MTLHWHARSRDARVRRQARLLLSLSCAFAQQGTPPPSQRQMDETIALVLRQHGTCKASAHVVVCVQADVLTQDELDEFHTLAEDGAQRIRTHLGEHLDLPGGNDRPVEFFLSNDVGIPHATIHPEPWIFLHPDSVRRRMAPYLHEMVHAMAQWSWRKSEWIAEGYANHVATRVVDGHAGYHRSYILPDGLAHLDTMRRSTAGREILPLIGLPGRRHTYPADAKALAGLLRSKRREYAPPYYAMSWSFVSHLVDAIGVDGLRAVAMSDDPSATLGEHSGKSMQEQLAAWEAALDKRAGSGG